MNLTEMPSSELVWQAGKMMHFLFKYTLLLYFIHWIYCGEIYLENPFSSLHILLYKLLLEENELRL